MSHSKPSKNQKKVFTAQKGKTFLGFFYCVSHACFSVSFDVNPTDRKLFYDSYVSFTLA